MEEIEEQGYTFDDLLAGLAGDPYYRKHGEHSNRGFMADFDWVIKPETNWQRIAERAGVSQEPEKEIPLRTYTPPPPRKLGGSTIGPANA